MGKIEYVGLDKIEYIGKSAFTNIFSNESNIEKKLNELIFKVNLLIDLKNEEMNRGIK